MRLILPLILLILPVTAFAELQIGNAWIKNLPPMMTMRAGYMSIHNPTDIAVTLIGVSSDRFTKVEFHESISNEGVMRMEMLHHLTIEPGATVELAPGGKHLMMMNPSEPTKPGETIEINLKLDDGSEQELKMRVMK
jgi:copper(I)-binding protein